MNEATFKRFLLPPEPEPRTEHEEIFEYLRAVAERAIQARRKPVAPEPVPLPVTAVADEAPKRVRYSYD